MFFNLDFLSQSLPTTFGYQNVHNILLNKPKGAIFAPICAIWLGRMLSEHIYLKKWQNGQKGPLCVISKLRKWSKIIMKPIFFNESWRANVLATSRRNLKKKNANCTFWGFHFPSAILDQCGRPWRTWQIDILGTSRHS